MTTRAVAVVALLGVALPATAGDYGLTVTVATGSSCAFPVQHSRNECTAEAVLHDLDRHFGKGEPLALEAVSMGFRTCSVWFASDEVRNRIYAGLVRLLELPEPHHEAGLSKAVGCFPFNSMLVALDASLDKGGHSPRVVARLRHARADVVRRLR